MSAQKQTDRIDSIREAATGYAVVVLGVICFLLVLVVVMAGVRVVVGTNTPASGNVAAAPASVTGTNVSRNGTA